MAICVDVISTILSSYFGARSPRSAWLPSQVCLSWLELTSPSSHLGRSWQKGSRMPSWMPTSLHDYWPTSEECLAVSRLTSSWGKTNASSLINALPSSRLSWCVWVDQGRACFLTLTWGTLDCPWYCMLAGALPWRNHWERKAVRSLLFSTISPMPFNRTPFRGPSFLIQHHWTSSCFPAGSSHRTPFLWPWWASKRWMALSCSSWWILRSRYGAWLVCIVPLQPASNWRFWGPAWPRAANLRTIRLVSRWSASCWHRCPDMRVEGPRPRYCDESLQKWSSSWMLQMHPTTLCFESWSSQTCSWQWGTPPVSCSKRQLTYSNDSELNQRWTGFSDRTSLLLCWLKRCLSLHSETKLRLHL